MNSPERHPLQPFEIRHGHTPAVLRLLPSQSVHCCVTSPPYWGLRDYGVAPIVWGGDPAHRHEWGPEILVNATNHVDKRRWNHAYNGCGKEQPIEKRPDRERHKIGQGNFCRCGAWRGALGLEPTPELYVAHVVEIFREVRRVLRADGTLWLNIGDSYTSGNRNTRDCGHSKIRPAFKAENFADGLRPKTPSGLKPKDLCMIPARLALALQADGWYLRSDIIWAKTNPMPESVTDRPTRSHEYVFLLSKSRKYFYDATAIREPFKYPERRYPPNTSGHKTAQLKKQGNRSTAGLHDGRTQYGDPEIGRNKRSVWTIATKPYAGAHFATYPTALVAPCVEAGTSERGCCPECGAPWQRLLRKSPVHPIDYDGKWHATASQDSGRRMLANLRGRRQAGEPHGNPFPAPTTVGWKPTCIHSHDPVPCTVLDPFCGSGTTGVVALRLRRRFLGIELNVRYVELANQRIAGDTAQHIEGNRMNQTAFQRGSTGESYERIDDPDDHSGSCKPSALQHQDGLQESGTGRNSIRPDQPP